MYLVDTNIWLERLLFQERSEEVGNFLSYTSSEHIYITDFTFHSICIIMIKLNQREGLLRFIQDLFVNGAVSLIHLEPEDTKRIIEVMGKFNLDFDDAYQYVAAEKYGLTLVSFDKDFDRTDRGRKTPQELLI